jgi:CNT family concentrative nucleoside transporter
MELIPSAGLSLTSLLRGSLGMLVLIFIAYLFSNNRKAIAWKTVGIGLLIQVVIAIGVLKIEWVKRVFETLGNFFIKVLEYTGEGTKMLLGEFGNTETYGFIFVFQALPVIIFFSALSSILYYFGVIQKVVGFLAWLLTKIFKISGAESLSVAGNIFLGQTEAPLLIKAYLEKMNRSEIFLVMVGGMATVAGSVLGAYIGFLGGNDPIQRLEFAKSLLAASVMAAPGAIVMAKIIYPQTEDIVTDISISNDKIGSNLLSAISIGTGRRN